VILAGLRGGRLDHRGRHYRYLGVPIELEPVQRPHPPVWQGVVNPDGAAAAARRGVNIVSTAPSTTLKTLVERFFEAWSGTADDAPLVGAQRHVYVAETDAEAMAIARPAYTVWYDSLTSLWRTFNTSPIRFADSLDRALEIDAAIVGSPETVRAELERHLTTSGCTYFVGRFMYGDLPFDRASRSLELFGREVMPHFTGVPRP